MIYAKGGGAVMFYAKSINSKMCDMAVNLNCIVFNVDYRLGPETKCPGGQQDFAKTIEHVYMNAQTLRVNPN